MPDLLVWILVFIASLAVLVKAADYFTDSAEKIGLFFGIPAFIVGVTIVAIGTSLPELVSSIIAVISGSSEIVVGNVVGSNIANIFLVLGLAAVVNSKIIISYELIRVDLPLLIGSAFFVAITIWDGVFTFPEGILALAGIVIYLTYTIKTEKEYKDVQIKKEMKEKVRERKKLGWKTIAGLVLGSVFIYFGARYTIESIIHLSGMIGIGTEIIAVSAVALGTSLPELMVSITAARKGKPEIAVGNILGSNIFNSFVVLGVPALIGKLIVPKSIIMFSLPVMLIATLFYFFITQDKQITKWEGWMLILFYILFIGKLFNLF